MVVKLTGILKKEFFDNLEIKSNSRSFWGKCKPYFSNKHSKGDSDILLIGKDQLSLKNKKVMIYSIPIFSESLTLLIFWMAFGINGSDSVDRIIDSSCFHPNIQNIKLSYKITNKFSVKPVSEELVKDIVNDLSSNKAASWWRTSHWKFLKNVIFLFIF